MSLSQKTLIARFALVERLRGLGFTGSEANALIRIEMTLHRWSEHECNGNIQRGGDDGQGKPRWFSGYDCVKGTLCPDRERGALKRLGKIIGDRNTRIWVASGNPSVATTAVSFYHQTDPRGAALYIIRPGDVRQGEDVSSVYNRGVCVCGR